MKLAKGRLVSKKSIVALLLVGVLSIGGLVLFFTQNRLELVDNAPANQPANQPKPKKPESTLSFSAMGDMLAHGVIVQGAKTADGYDFLPYFASIQPFYESSDVVFCNPETPAGGAKYGISGYPVFNAPTELSRDLRKTGCNLINFASNHAVDKGQEALNDTLNHWQKLEPLAIAGANRSAEEQCQVAYFEKNGLKVAFLAFADFSNLALPHDYSVNLYHDKTLLNQLLAEARKQADVVIMSVHWGTEDSHEVNGDQQQLTQTFAEMGVDLVIGTGPHVLQKVSKIKRPDGGEMLVWYSIGNMLSSQFQTDELTGGIAQFKLTKKDDEIQFSDIKFVSTFMSYRWPASNNSHNRYDPKLKPLKDAQAETALFDTTVEERFEKVRQWLGTEVEIAIE